MLYLGTIFQVAVLFINAIAILNEERFLARSTCVSLGHEGWELMFRYQSACLHHHCSSSNNKVTHKVMTNPAMLPVAAGPQILE
jgi:hypothetical protein